MHTWCRGLYIWASISKDKTNASTKQNKNQMKIRPNKQSNKVSKINKIDKWPQDKQYRRMKLLCGCARQCEVLWSCGCLFSVILSYAALWGGGLGWPGVRDSSCLWGQRCVFDYPHFPSSHTHDGDDTIPRSWSNTPTQQVFETNWCVEKWTLQRVLPTMATVSAETHEGVSQTAWFGVWKLLHYVLV